MSSRVPVKRRLRKPPRQFHHGDLAEALVRAATELVEKEGHATLSLRVLAKRLGVTQPALYRHYASKDALLAEVAARGLKNFLNEVRRAMAEHDDPFAALEAAGRAYVRAAHANAGWFRLQFSRLGSEHLMRVSPIPAETLQMAVEFRTEVLERTGSVIPPGGAAVDDVYRAFWALAHGLATFVVERVFQLVQTDEERIAAADDALHVFIEALRRSYAATRRG